MALSRAKRSRENEDEDCRKEGEEGRNPVAVREVVKVSQKEKEEHELTHTPFRPWCRYCVRGRGKNEAHRRRGSKEDKDMEVPKNQHGLLLHERSRREGPRES